jgi:hypothetical protein
VPAPKKSPPLSRPEMVLAPPPPEKAPALKSSRHRDPPTTGEVLSPHLRAQPPHLRRPSRPRPTAPKTLGRR